MKPNNNKNMSKGVSEMIIQKPNCGNCPNTSCYNNLIRQDKILTLEQTLETRVSYVAVRDHTKTHGCLSHPNAREYLMAPVIKELERKRTKAQKEITREFLEQDTYREGIVKMCGEAIILIRDGVK